VVTSGDDVDGRWATLRLLGVAYVIG
jgi:hypothetical protein